MGRPRQSPFHSRHLFAVYNSGYRVWQPRRSTDVNFQVSRFTA